MTRGKALSYVTGPALEQFERSKRCFERHTVCRVEAKYSIRRLMRSRLGNHGCSPSSFCLFGVHSDADVGLEAFVRRGLGIDCFTSLLRYGNVVVCYRTQRGTAESFHLEHPE